MATSNNPHTPNTPIDTLLREGRQLIFAADRSPAELRPLGSEIITRLTGGLVCGMNAADYATRLEILVVLRTFPGRGRPVRFEFRFRDITGRAAFRRTWGIFLFLIGR